MRYLQQLAVLSAVVAAVACGTKDATGPLDPTGAIGRVRFVNMITDTTRGRVNVILERVPFGVNLTYGQSTPATLPAPSTANYSAVLAGAREMLIKRTVDTNVTVATVSFTASVGLDQTVYAIGGAAGSAVTSLVMNDTNPAVTGNPRIRAVNLSPTGGPLDIFFTAANADLATATPTFANVPVRGASSYATIAPGTYSLRAVPAGTAPAARAAAVSINVPGIVLAATQARTFVTADRNIGGLPLTAFVLTDR